jgi:cytoskeletal protein RodZ
MITVGEVLKSKREKLRISLEKASSDTKIQKRFLQYIEKDTFTPFQSEVFLTGFIKIYAKYLGLDIKKILALYRRTNPVIVEKDIQTTPQQVMKKKIVITPKTVVIILVSLFTLLIAAYITSQIYKFQTPPKLEIMEPAKESTVEKAEIIVKGKVEKEATVEINDVAVKTDENGHFEKEITLVEGSNLISIKAKKNNNNILESVETLTVKYEPKKEQQEEAQEVQEKVNKITLEIFETPVWIKLDIDNVNVVAQVLEPTKKEFEIKNKFNIISGRVSNTKIFFNEKELTWPATSKKGVVGMECTVTESSIDCK